MKQAIRKKPRRKNLLGDKLLRSVQQARDWVQGKPVRVRSHLCPRTKGVEVSGVSGKGSSAGLSARAASSHGAYRSGRRDEQSTSPQFEGGQAARRLKPSPRRHFAQVSGWRFEYLRVARLSMFLTWFRQGHICAEAGGTDSVVTVNASRHD
jgi:hypothetical protein